MSPGPPHLSSISNFFQSSPTPAECPTTQGGFAAHPAPLRSAGLLLPPGPPYGSNIPTAGTASGAVSAPAAASGRRDPDRPVPPVVPERSATAPRLPGS